MKLLLVGATGLVGRHVLEVALADARVDQVIVVARRPLSPHPKMRALEVDFDHLPDTADWWHADAVICTLGTTMRAAGPRRHSGASTTTIRSRSRGSHTATAHRLTC